MAQAKTSSKRKSPQSVHLNQKLVDGYKPEAKLYRKHDKTVPGFVLLVGKSGQKSWYIHYKNREHRNQSYRFGSVSQYNVKDARAEARRLLTSIKGGADPAGEKRSAREEAEASLSRTLRLYLHGNYWAKHLKALDKGNGRDNGTAILRRIESTYADLLDRDMVTITSLELNEMRQHRFDDGKAMSTLNRDRICIHGLFEHALAAKVITSNPANKYDHVPYKKKIADSKRVRYLGQRDEYETHPQSERERFMAALLDMPDQFQTVVHIALNTGLRRYEILSLEWGDISLTNNTVTVRAGNAKSREERTVPVNPTLRAVLKRWKTLKGNVVNIKSLVFPSDITGDVVVNIKRQWDKLTEVAKIEDFHFHDQRHDFASELVNKGHSLEVVAELLGHADLSMAKRYSHLNKKTLADAVGSLG